MIGPKAGPIGPPSRLFEYGNSTEDLGIGPHEADATMADSVSCELMASDTDRSGPGERQDADNTFTPVHSATGFGATYEHWPICSDISDPRLGLSLEQLTETLAPLGLADGWGRSQADELAEATWLLLSHKVGNTINGRVALSNWSRVVMRLALARPPGGEEVVFREFGDMHAEYVRENKGRGIGFGSARGMWRRIVAASPYRHVHGDPRDALWAVKSVTDYAPLDEAWELATSASAVDDEDLGGSALVSPGGLKLLPLLPLELLTAMFPARRLACSIRTPSTWEMVAVLLALGPDRVARRAQCELRSSSARGATLDTLRSSVGDAMGFIRAAEAVAAYSPIVAPWRKPVPVRVTSAAKRRAKPSNDRAAPSLARVRAARAEGHRKLERARRTRRSTTVWPDTAEYSHTKRMLLLELCAQTGSRPNEIVSRQRGHFNPAYDFGEHGVWPAIWSEPSKEIAGSIRPVWKPIHHTTADLLQGWLREWGPATPDAPLFPSSSIEVAVPMNPNAASSFFSGSAGATRTIPHPDRPDGPGYGLNTLRHLVEQLAFAVGAAFLDAQPSWNERLTPQVFADALSLHVFRDETHAYKDLEANRQVWATRAALGVPRLGVPGVIELIMGDAGARRSWDTEAMRAGLSLIEHASDQLRAAEVDYERASLELASCEKALRSTPRATDEIETQDVLNGVVLLQKRLADMERRDEIRDQADAARDRRHDADARRLKAEQAIETARRDLRELELVGRTTLIRDDSALDDRTNETESFEDALSRIRAEAASVDIDVALGQVDCVEATMRVREVLNLKEWAALWATHEKTVRRHISGQRQSPVALNGAIVKVGKRFRFIDTSLLAAGWRDHLTVSQREMLEQILRMPLGQTRFGGNTATAEQLDRANRLSPGPDAAGPNPRSPARARR